MTTVTYTTAEDLDSSALDDAYYNENTKVLVVGLHGCYYAYPDVPKHVYEGLLEAKSAGKFYRKTIKNYGPAEKLGYLAWDQFDEVDVIEKPRALVAFPSSGVGTPKALVETPQTVITNVTNQYGLSAPVPASDYRKYAVTFEVDGDRKTHNVRAESDLDAVASVLDLAHVLGLDFIVKEVTGYFE